MQHPAEQSPLGKSSEYVSSYAPHLLFPISREAKWAELGLTGDNLPYQGVDIWTCYEMSWLLPSGKPVVAVAEFSIPANSPNIIESKSFKLYLNSLNQSVFADMAALEQVLISDLSKVAGAPVSVRLCSVDALGQEGMALIDGQCIDDLDICVSEYEQPNPQLLKADFATQTQARLYSHLLKSNCPVTGQPDWGSLVVEYQGPELDPSSLLAYVVSFRQHQDFHEQCVERIFLDLQQLLQPKRLMVYARYVRRGGLDINPYRSSDSHWPVSRRLARQ